MPAAHIDGEDRPNGREPPGNERRGVVGIDTDVFEILSAEEWLGQCGDRPRIERWLGCWADR